MAAHPLARLFRPESIALIGASERPGSVGATVLRNLLTSPFPGVLRAVNPSHRTLMGAACYPDVSALPETPDLAVLACPARAVPGALASLAARGAKAAVIISAGFDAEDRRRLREFSLATSLRILGPNCLGLISPLGGFNASFSHATPDVGGLSLITQSGAVAAAVIDRAAAHGIGFSHILSLGDMADIDIADSLDFLAEEAETTAILVYAETILSPRRFIEAARRASAAKPVVMLKAGRSASGARAALSHTGALASEDDVIDAVIRRTGLLRATTLQELFTAAELFSCDVRSACENLLVVTNGGGLGVLAADSMEASGAALKPLTAPLAEQLRRVLPSPASVSNPVDILGDAGADRYLDVLEASAASGEHDAILIMNCPTGVADREAAAREVGRYRRVHGGATIIACWAGESLAGGARARLRAAGVPCFETPEQAVSASRMLADRGRPLRAREDDIPPSSAVRLEEPRRIIRRARLEGRRLLLPDEARQIATAFGVAFPRSLLASDPQEAGERAAGLDGEVVLKVRSPDIVHKSDVGGVRIGLRGSEQVERAAKDMLAVLSERAPGARIEGFSIDERVVRPHAAECIMGIFPDPVFGPCLLFGTGGVAAEALRDRAIGLPPLTYGLALDMIGRTRIYSLLKGYRHIPPADLEAICRALCSLSEMALRLPEIAEADINPVLADATGAIALDARIILHAEAGENTDHKDAAENGDRTLPDRSGSS